MLKAVIIAGVVTNIVEWDSTMNWTPPVGSVLVDLVGSVSPGDLWNGTTFTPAPVPITVQNETTITDKIISALLANAADLTQDAAIVTQATTLAATTGTRTLAQLSGDVRSLATVVKILAQNDIATKKELGALIRLILNQFDTTDGT